MEEYLTVFLILFAARAPSLPATRVISQEKTTQVK
jgi:hypothetical protein